MLWPQLLSTAFLVLAVIILWMSQQGMFSRKIAKPEAPQSSAQTDECADLKALVKRLQGKIFELENELSQKNARISDLNGKLAQLMEDINRLSGDLLASQAREAAYNKALKQALEDLQACRAALAQCKADNLARQIRDAACKMQPENANLLR